MTRDEVDAWADASEVELVLYDGMDDAIVGIGQRFNTYFVVYDAAKVIDTMVTRDGMTTDEAIEFYEFNVVGGWVGEGTPCFVTTQIEA